MRWIYHIATRADWEQAQAAGEYAVSTVGRTLAEEGFIHASQLSQVDGTANRFYRDVPGDLLLLKIDVQRLRAELRLEEAPGADLPFPHLYGPLNLDAVASADLLNREPDGTLSRVVPS